jgi:translation initiation factor 1
MFISILFASDGMASSLIDPFAEANAEDSGAGPGTKDYVHVRIQQRNGRKSLTTVQGLKKEFSYNKILKDLKKEFCCNGTVVQDPELGQVRCENNAFQARKMVSAGWWVY